VEKDGFYYGRGTQDMKVADAIMVTTLIRMKKENYQPDRDIILALTADEEGGQSNGVDWLIKNQRSLIDAEFVLNPDGGGVETENGKPIMMVVDATEKVYADYELTALNPGGHSSIPIPDNAIYHIANGLVRLEHYKFPFELNNVTRAYYDRISQKEKGPRASDMKAILKTPPDQKAIDRLSQDPIDNSTLHTTCVATRLSGGHANNALPQQAHANVNCRILPGHSSEEVRQELVKVFADPKIEVRYQGAIGGSSDHGTDAKGYAPPPLRDDVFKPLEKLVAEMWPGAIVVPDMATGASDGVYTNAAGLPTYAVSGVALERTDVRAHGKDERIGIDSYYTGVDFYYRYLRAITAQ
jgi:acetylornithine deacetylase/succinyl-diaminopimelate desuccinylase-like protein